MSTATERLQTAQQKALSIRPKVGGFPVLAAILKEAGVRENEWTLPAAQSVYRTDFGPVVQLGTPLATGSQDIPPFDRDAVIRAIRTDQAGQSTFPEFLESAFLAGVVRYVADFEARTVTYYGVDGDTYIEEYPSVNLDELLLLHPR